MKTFYPEMNEAQPESQIVARFGYGKYSLHSLVQLPPMQGLNFQKVFVSADLVPEAQHLIGQYYYHATPRAMERLEKKYTVALECLL